MAVKIKGLRLFNMNCYDKITIIEKEGNYTVNIQEYQKVMTGLHALSLQKDIETKKTQNIASYDFKTDNKGKTDEQQVVNILKKFLEYSIINTLEHKWITYKSKYEIASGTRQLKICLFNPKLENVFKMIVKKYLEDRLKFCSINNNVNNISISTSEYSSYYLEDNIIKFYLMKKENSIESLERQFFKDFISNKLNKVDKFVNLKHSMIIIDNKRYMLSPMYIISENLNVEIQGDLKLYDIVNELVRKHNNELQQSKMIQLKIPSF